MSISAKRFLLSNLMSLYNQKGKMDGYRTSERFQQNPFVVCLLLNKKSSLCLVLFNFRLFVNEMKETCLLSKCQELKKTDNHPAHSSSLFVKTSLSNS